MPTLETTGEYGICPICNNIDPEDTCISCPRCEATGRETFPDIPANIDKGGWDRRGTCNLCDGLGKLDAN